MTDVKGDKTQTFSAEATSGASGKNVAIAGSLAINLMDAQSIASVKSGADVTLNDSVKTFDPTSANVDLTNNTIDLVTAHNLKTGDAVIYKNGGGTDIGGLKNGTTYYVIISDADKIKLASTAANAAKGTAIDLTTRIRPGPHTHLPTQPTSV